MRSSPDNSDPEWPTAVPSLFREYDPDALDWDTDRDLIIRRVLSEGNWEAIKWLRARIDDASLRDWIESQSGDTLSPRPLRFWELILDLPSDRVDEWVAARRISVWANRTGS